MQAQAGKISEVAREFNFSQRTALWVVPRVTALVLTAIAVTLRFRVVAEDGAVPAVPPAKGIFCFWHRSTLLCGWYFRKYQCTVLISRSFDGELIARTLGALGYESVRGSSSRGGASGLLAAEQVLKGDGAMAFTADGPRGPIYHAKMGPVKLAQMTGRPIGCFYLLPERAWVMNSWDRFLIPKPFSRVAVSWARAVEPPAADADATVLEAKRVELDNALERARAQAEAYFAR